MPRVRIGPALPDHKKLEAEIAQLRDLGVKELRGRWQSIIGQQPPPHLPRHLLFRILAYRLQANRFGDGPCCEPNMTMAASRVATPTGRPYSGSWRT
jgi:hypothetical protein